MRFDCRTRQNRLLGRRDVLHDLGLTGCLLINQKLECSDQAAVTSSEDVKLIGEARVDS